MGGAPSGPRENGEERSLAGVTEAGSWRGLSPGVGPVGEGGGAWRAQCVAPHHRDKREWAGYRDLVVTEVTDPQRVVLGQA